MFILDGKRSDITLDDIKRRNTIASLLQDWKLCTVVNPKQIDDKSPMANIKIVPYSEKKNWVLESKYKIGGKR